MTIKSKISIITILLFFAVTYLPSPVHASGRAFTYSQFSQLDSSDNSLRETNRSANDLGELSIENLVTLKIAQQPYGNTEFVSPYQNYVTEYQTASNYGTVGLLAHNYLAGRYFIKVMPGQEITLVYKDNKVNRFVVTEIQRYQALTPDSPSSDFIDLANGKYLTASQLFKKIYADQPGRLILQTCIYAEQDPGWGRLFIIADTVE